MNREYAFLMVLLTILVVSSSTALEVQGVEASATVYIRADGSIAPPTAPISTVDNITYTFTGDISDSIVIERNNIVVDGAGYIVEGTGSGYGITLSGRTSVTIKNMTIKAFGQSIGLDYSSNNSILGNNITNNGGGIRLSSSAGNSISGNKITNNGIGIWLESSSTNSIFGNNITNNNSVGIVLFNSASNTISENNITANKAAIDFDVDSDNNTISGNKITNNERGITLYSSSSNSIFENTITANGYYGIELGSSSNNIISGNNVTNNGGAGIELSSSAGNSISGNDITNDVRGIVLDSSSNNGLSGNNVTNNNYGIELSISSDNFIFYNNFVDNTNQVSAMFSSVNIWDDGSRGNYWSDYLTKYPNATEIDSSGVWNIPYVIDMDNTDHYPLMTPYIAVHDIAATNVTLSKTVIGRGYILSINVAVANQGGYTENFNATAYANTTIIAAQVVTLTNGNFTTLTLTWKTTGFAYGNCTIWAYVEPVPGETNTADNNLTGGTIRVTIPGDIKGDFNVNLLDAILLSNAYNSQPNSPNWNANADIDGNNIVNILDAIILSNHYNQHYP